MAATHPAERPDGRRAARGDASRHLLSIGAVLDLVREEFPDLKHSKLHYLEDQGLLTPQRTASGYRKYSRDDVDRLLFILRAQRDRFWPLKVIREHLAAADSGDPSIASLADRDGGGSEPVRTSFDRRQLCFEAQIDEALLTQLEEFGLLPRRRRNFFGLADLEIAKAARVMADNGLQPRHLVMLRNAVDRQAHQIRSVSDPQAHRQDPAAAGMAAETDAELGEAAIAIYSSLLRITLEKGR